MNIKLGIIGGSGLDDPKILKDAKELSVETPYGKPSSQLTVGNISGINVVLLARHGRKHNIMPTKVPYQANIWALKEQGVTHIIATTACGSLRESIKPGELVLLDQFIDRTTRRTPTFYENDRVCHIPMAEPFCPELRALLSESADGLNLKCHKKGTVVTIEGPRFSTKAESRLYQSWGADVINMSTVPEVVLAREAGICYQVIAMATDYDCFSDSLPHVTIDEVFRIMKHNVDNVKDLIIKTAERIKENPECRCRHDIKTALIGD